jgi:cytoskeletal protein RodZ
MTYPPIPPHQELGPPPSPKSRLTFWSRGPGVILVVVAVGLVLVGIGAVMSMAGTTPTATKPASAWEQEQARKVQREPTVAAAPATADAPSATPAASDIALTAKVTRKKCFGSAGCNIDFKVEMAYGGPALSEDDTWEITYEVTGVEDGPMIGSLELTGTTFTATEESVSTSGSKKKLTVKVTSVSKVGI